MTTSVAVAVRGTTQLISADGCRLSPSQRRNCSALIAVSCASACLSCSAYSRASEPKPVRMRQLYAFEALSVGRPWASLARAGAATASSPGGGGTAGWQSQNNRLRLARRRSATKPAISGTAVEKSWNSERGISLQTRPDIATAKASVTPVRHIFVTCLPQPRHSRHFPADSADPIACTPPPPYTPTNTQTDAMHPAADCPGSAPSRA